MYPWVKPVEASILRRMLKFSKFLSYKMCIHIFPSSLLDVTSHSFKIVSIILKAAKSQDMPLYVKAQGPISLPTPSPEPLAKAIWFQLGQNAIAGQCIIFPLLDFCNKSSKLFAAISCENWISLFWRRIF